MTKAAFQERFRNAPYRRPRPQLSTVHRSIDEPPPHMTVEFKRDYELTGKRKGEVVEMAEGAALILIGCGFAKKV